MDVLPAYPGTHGVDKKEDEYSADAEKRDIAAGQVQDAFGSEEDAEIKYKTLTWWQCGLLMICESVSLGVLSLPAAVATLGLVPGVILIVGLGLLALYTGYNIGLFRERYPHIQSLADAGEILLGRFGRELFGLGQFLFCIFVMGSHILTFRVMMNTITEHATCSIVFSVVGMLISMILSIPRTMKGMTWVSFASFLSIFGAVMITMISVSVQDFPGRTIDATVETNLYTGFQAVSNIVFAYCAHVAFFGLIAEMENPKDFNKSLLMLQSFEICLYLTAAVVIYYYVGTDVHSPALTSAGPVMKKVAYGIAIPTIVGAGVVNGHIGLKYIYFRACRKSDLLHSRSWKSVSIWLALGFVCWVVAWIISEGIPVFSNLNSLISALFASWFSYGLSGIYWLHLNYGQWLSSPSKILLTILNIGIALIGLILCVLGLYASGTAIHNDASSTVFSCANTDT
ncbi:transmembrane amino acid transporter protein-domain-containing protein [Aspergillus pseudonomiae]|uniref:Transmembrane amino acid transporter protein-domain-containing protein n=1 Tax=Aspergillus pseudonomiae TaxID=1506151 RepID=A0A5N7CUD4_9EURO|nr:transmembrane amino acid transporter protein-domain-containing protein [Aspergillus pseudonomiae]KAB8257399.1 transmembrane amino acid transporter protein-domain-containing protein [Aspergillus pseudonomiae]KAE8397792.1 transmembrane amino acid transporter protein-domain-containing protein [Aspergillus pseudonomiae]